MKFDKYKLYEYSVQTPETHTEFFKQAYSEITGRKARFLREDFCGTFINSIHWVKDDPEHHAIAYDLDLEPLDYGKTHHLSKLTPQQKSRLHFAQKNATSVSRPLVDIQAACNFSFFILKDPATLAAYFKSSLKSLRSGGLLVLEMAGGPGFVAELKEWKKMKRGAQHWFTYVWEQRKFDPISHHGECAIHFKFPNGHYAKNVFQYDWRIWTIPEVTDALKQAGFIKTFVYWEDATPGGMFKGTYRQTERAENDYTWISYIIGQKE